MPANDDTPAEDPLAPMTIETLAQALVQSQAHAELIHQVTKRTLRELTVRIHDLENEVTNLRSTIRRGRL